LAGNDEKTCRCKSVRIGFFTIGIVGLSYSTIPLFKAKRFPVPLTASISYRDRFTGENNVLDSQYLYFGAMVYF